MNTALVIGGTTGIGMGTAQILRNNDYQVIVSGIENSAIEFINNKNSNSIKAEYLDCINSSVSEYITQKFEELKKIDLIIFSAGIGNLNKGLGFTVENKANQLNVLAFTEAVDHSYRLFEKQGYGHLVAVTSFSCLFGSRVAPAYHAAKAYQQNYLEGIRQKAKKSKLNITITEARPGFVQTPMTEGKKMFWMANQEQAGKTIYKLIQNKSSYGYITKRWYLLGAIIKKIPLGIRKYF